MEIETIPYEPCNICGCTQTELVDGFYYCTECGTQDTNVRETAVELVTVEGAAARGTRKRITQIPQAKQEDMTDDWYKWHSLNFLLKGLADELIEHGAAPSFKIKLLWVWTRYMKKYQNNADFGMAANDDLEGNLENEVDKVINDDNDNTSSSDENEDGEILQRKKKIESSRDIKKISMGLVMALLYVALNLDKSHIQLAQLIRLMREGRVSILQWQTLIPKELRPNKLRKCLFFKTTCFKYSYENIRILSFELFRTLDLGNPIVPDLRPLVDLYMQELCLPEDLKPLVISLIHYRSFDYLDVNVQYENINRIPSYELHVMSHILMALKICFGLDCEYEVKLSDAVEKINELEHYPKSYNSEPTERLFSFREWYNYIQFRKTLLRAHTLHLGTPNYFDMDDYVTFEHLNEKPDHNIIWSDEIAMNIIKKIPSTELNVIPRSEFVSTMTPHTSYTRVILEHLKDPDVKRLLSEDFTQYSLKYIMKDMFLVDPDSVNPQNILTGVSELNKQERHCNFDVVDPSICFSRGMVYVKDCDNDNWLITQRPQLEHVTELKSSDKGDENDHGYESNSETSRNTLKTINLDITQESLELRKNNNTDVLNNDSKVYNDISSVTDNEKNFEQDERHDGTVLDNSCMIVDPENEFNKNIENFIIREEDEGKCIFDDDFIFMDTKKEEEPENIDTEMPNESEINESFNMLNNYEEHTQNYRTGRDSDDSSADSIQFNPESLNRNEAIEKLVIHACQKYKVSIPGKYRVTSRRKDHIRKTPRPKVPIRSAAGEQIRKINSLISAYHSHVQNDILHQMSNMVQSAIADFNETKDDPQSPMESEDRPNFDDHIDANNYAETTQNEPNNTTLELDKNETVVEEKQYKIFSDNSDGETHADELLPKKNPKFDKETHDIKQLYIKQTDDSNVPEMKINSKLLKIIDEKIEAKKNNPDLVEAPDLSTNIKEKSDSEEDVCLSILKEQKLQRQQLREQAKPVWKQLIDSKIPSYKYWMRHYDSQLAKLPFLNQRFATELDEKLPNSFMFVLKECADVVGYPPFSLYRGLQRVEGFLKDKFVSRKRFHPNYFVKTKKKLAKTNDF